MASTSRPVRNRNQPSRNKDNVELNLQLIEKLEANRGNKNNATAPTNYAKLLSCFVNSVNEHYRTSLSKKENAKKEQGLAKGKAGEQGDQAQWGPARDKKKYIMGSTVKTNPKAFQSSLPQEERQIEKNNNQITKNTRAARNTPGSQLQSSQPPARSQPKQVKKVVLVTPQPQQSIDAKKPFKRSSYHIGIAYTIYMTQMREKNPLMTDPRHCDPTSCARRLKAEQGGPQK